MPYYLTKTNGDALVTLEDGTLDTTTADLALVGKNYPTYGLNLNQNFVKLLENFSNVDEPAAPLLGQLWYDSTNKKIKLYREGADTNVWVSPCMITESTSAPSDSRQGDLWFDTGSEQLKVYSGTVWITVGPQTTSTGLLRIAGTNSFIVQISGNTVLSVDASGNLTAPTKPIVQASGLYGSSNFTTASAATFSLWRPLTITTDAGTNFSAGTFTVPVTGKYRVHINATTLGPGVSNLRWRVNDVDYGINGTTNHNSQSGYSMNLALGGIIYATAGQLITLVGSTDSGTYISYQNNSYSIELVG